MRAILVLTCAMASAHGETNAPVAPPAPVATTTNAAVAAPTNAVPATAAAQDDPQVEQRYQNLLKLDDAALEETQGLIDRSRAQQGSELKTHSEDETRQLIQAKLASVKKAYQSFLKDNPGHVRAMIAYGSFLRDIDEEEEGLQWWLKARTLDPKNPAVHNNLGNYYSHAGDPKQALTEYETAIALQPSEPTYYLNYGNLLYLFRKDVAEAKHWTEDEACEHALEALRKARDLEPNNYEYAYSYAETFYGVKNPGWPRAIEAWEYCLKLNITPLQRDQIYTHLARIYIRLGQIQKARGYLAEVKSEQWQDLKERLLDIAKQQEAARKVEDTLKPDTTIVE